MKNRRFSCCIVLVFALLCGIRLIYITADPPTELSWSGGLFFDEGALAHNARNKVLFGQWELDEWNDFYYSPILTYIKWTSFSLFGVGLAQERLVPILFSWFILITLYSALKMAFSRTIALAGVTVLGLNYLFLMYNRLGLTETPLLLWAALTLFFWRLGLQAERKYRGLWMFLAGGSCFMIYIFKALLVYFLPVPLAALVLLWLFAPETGKRRHVLLAALYCAAGMLVTAGVWALVFYYPNYDAIHQAGDYVKMLSLPHSLEAIWRNVSRNPFFGVFLRTPVTLVLAFLGLLIPGYALFHKREHLEAIDLFMGLWFMAHLFFFMAYSYRPTRYYVPIIPPMSFLAVRAGIGLFKVREARVPRQRISWWFWGVSGIVSLFLLVHGLLPPIFVAFNALVQERIHLGAVESFSAGMVLTGLLIWGLARWTQRHRGQRLPVPQQVFPATAILLALVFLGINGGQYARWLAQPRFEVRDTSRELGAMLSGQAFLAGLATPTLCLENTHRALYVWENFFNDQAPFSRHAVTHLFLAEFNDELAYYEREFPEMMQRARLLKRYVIGGLKLYLFSVVEPSFEVEIESGPQTEPPFTLMLAVKNNDPRQERVVDFNWSWKMNDTFAHGAEHARLAPLESQPIVQKAIAPPGEITVTTQRRFSSRRIYEAEELPSVIGKIQRDAAASNGYARYASRKSHPGRGFLMYGPYWRYPAGELMVEFVLRYAPTSLGASFAEDQPIARIDIATEQGEVIMFERELTPQDFSQAGQYQSFQSMITFTTPQAPEFRVLSYGKADIWVDAVNVSFQGQESQRHRLNFDHLEADTMRSQLGSRRADPQASQGQAQYSAADGQEGVVAFGRRRNYPEGMCTTDFTLKYVGSPTDEPVATLDAATDGGRIVLSRQILYPDNFTQPDTYQTFRLNYLLKQPRTLEFRVHTYGKAELWLDTITTHCVNTNSDLL